MCHQTLGDLADEFGIIVLAPESRSWTWGSILGDWDPDLEFLQLAMMQIQKRCTVDRERIWLGGFSDGASMSLALGISYGTIFRRVYAGSPGLLQPIAANGKPPIFISHGRADPTMPIDDTSRQFVPRLKRLGYDVTYREYDGRHQLPPEVLREVIVWMTRNDLVSRNTSAGPCLSCPSCPCYCSSRRRPQRRSSLRPSIHSARCASRRRCSRSGCASGSTRSCRP